MQPEMGSSAEWLERELKVVTYADSLPAYHQFCRAEKGKYVLGAGTDRYFKHPVFDLPVVRHRFSGDFSELTVKTPVHGHGNAVRQEVNLRLEGTADEVEKLLQLQGYGIAIEISKISHIYYLPHVVLSYYTVMTPAGEPLRVPDMEMVPARFIEVELREDLDWTAEYRLFAASHKQAWRCGDRAIPISRGCRHAEDFCYEVMRGWLTVLSEAGVRFKPVPLEASLWQMFGERVVLNTPGETIQ